MENRVLPIKPKDVFMAKCKYIPDQVIETINEMIINMWNGNSATLFENELIELILQKLGESNNIENRNKIYDNHWLDFEDIYREQGWKVEYDEPYYNEDYPARYIFIYNR